MSLGYVYIYIYIHIYIYIYIYMWLFYFSVIAIFDVTLAADFYTRMSLFFSTVTKLGHRVTHGNCETGNTTKQSF